MQVMAAIVAGIPPLNRKTLPPAGTAVANRLLAVRERTAFRTAEVPPHLLFMLFFPALSDYIY